MRMKQTESGTVLCACERASLDSWRHPRGTLRRAFEVKEVCHSEWLGHVSEKDTEIIR